MILSVMRRFCVLIFLAGLTGSPAFADSMFTLTFDPLIYTTTPSGTVHMTATVLNTGTTTLANWNATEETFFSSPFFTTDQNVSSTGVGGAFPVGNMLLPGNSVSFDYIDVFFTNAPAGSYKPIETATLTLFDAAGALVAESAPQIPMITIPTAVPEPGTLVLLGTGALGLVGAVRRRYCGRA